jgi:uncharacterized membrane protein
MAHRRRSDVGEVPGSLSGSASPRSSWPSSASDFSVVGPAVLELRPIGIAQVGLLVLVATPVVRVMASVVAFVLERDRLYAAITLGVLAILLGSLFGLR